MSHVTQEEATANLPKLIDQATQTGEEITIMRDNVAVARIVPVPSSPETQVTKPRIFYRSTARGLLVVSKQGTPPFKIVPSTRKPVLGTTVVSQEEANETAQ